MGPRRRLLLSPGPATMQEKTLDVRLSKGDRFYNTSPKRLEAGWRKLEAGVNMRPLSAAHRLDRHSYYGATKKTEKTRFKKKSIFVNPKSTINPGWGKIGQCYKRRDRERGHLPREPHHLTGGG